MIYLDIGTHKTASSLRQQVLEFNAHKLPFLYEKQLDLLGALLVKKAPLEKKDIRRLRRNWTESYKDKDVFLSCEGFSGNLVEALNNTEAIAEDLKHIFMDCEVNVFCFIRDQADYIESIYAQMVKGGYYRKFEDFLIDYNWRALNWLDKLNIYHKQFGSVKALPYPCDDCVNSLLNAIQPGLSIEYDNTAIANPSLNNQGLSLGITLNRHLDTNQQWEYRTFLERCFMKGPGEPFGLFTDNQRELVREYFKQSNEELWKLYG